MYYVMYYVKLQNVCITHSLCYILAFMLAISECQLGSLCFIVTLELWRYSIRLSLHYEIFHLAHNLVYDDEPG